MIELKSLEWHVHKGLIGYKICAYDLFGHEFSRYDTPNPEDTMKTNAFIFWQMAEEARYKSIIRSAFSLKGIFYIGDMVQKKSGSWWEGEVVGYYSTNQTPIGYAVQLITEEGNGPVQIYPESALERKY